jgi:hypothetical protein
VLLDPGFLTSTSWAHQVAYHALQDEIDEVFVEINKVVATALAGASTSAVGKYSDHSKQVLAAYEPIFDRFFDLEAGECKDISTTVIQGFVSSSGMRSANCISAFSRGVTAEADAATEALSGFSGDYGKVLLNVYRSYVGKNAMVDSEHIEANINSTFASIAANWEDITPAVDELRANLNANVNGFSSRLDTCFTSSYDFANSLLVIMESQVEECEEFQASRNSRARSVNTNGFKDYRQDFEALVANYPQFVW